MAARDRLTPMLRHYLTVKAQHPDALLLYRMGDFYELFFEDAERAAPLLEIALTARQKGSESEAPMCGIPHHALDAYVGKLLRAGLRVAICEQVEDPAEARGLVRREVTRVLTPGTLSEPNLLEGRQANLLAALIGSAGSWAVGSLELSTGTLTVERQTGLAAALDALARPGLREVLVEDPPEELTRRAAADRWTLTPLDERWFERRRAGDDLARHFGVSSLRGFGLEEGEPAVVACAALLAYGRYTQQRPLDHVRGLDLRRPEDVLLLDAATLRNLEVFQPAQGEGGPTLLSTVDRCTTAQGGRLLRDWLRTPLTEAAAIERRLDAVQALLTDGSRRRALRQGLQGLGDLERLAGRAVLGSLTPREAVALRDGLRLLPEVLAAGAGSGAALLEEAARLEPQAPLRAELERVLEEEAAPRLGGGAVIAGGVDSELDEVRSLATDSRRHILELQARERTATGIASLKVRYNKVFHYTIEVTRPHLALVPEHYERRQTLANAERFVTPELKELEARILGAEARLAELEELHFGRLRQRIAEAASALGDLGRASARLDVVAGFAELAADRGYVRPGIDPVGAPLRIRRGRHPVLEAGLGGDFVPNDCQLDAEDAAIVVLTGPNMGGKSTYLRQVALIVLLAQAGSFVPAEEARVGLVDRLFTRVGASDDLARGESTFMVEMIETANILHAATPASLVVLDEVGRGTATFDGLSLAWAIVEHLQAGTRPKTLFATHYHELTDLADRLPGVVNRTMAVQEWKDRIVFLRQVVPGAADRSYGLHVARLAGLPEAVLERAAEVLAQLEGGSFGPHGVVGVAAEGGGGRAEPGAGASQGTATSPAPDTDGRQQLHLFQADEDLVLRLLRETAIEDLTPLAALNLLATLQGRLRGEDG